VVTTGAYLTYRVMMNGIDGDPNPKIVAGGKEGYM